MLSLAGGVRFEWQPGQGLGFADVELPQGGTLVVQGPSGAGKSTLLALIAGLLTPSAGRVVVGGTDVGALPRAARDRWRGATLGFVPQRLHLSESLTVEGNLALPYVACGEAVDHGRIAALLERLGLAGLARRRPHELSVGQAQRVALARALMRRPRMLLADEPTANLDMKTGEEIIDLLRQLKETNGVTVVSATHDMKMLSVSDRVVWIRDGIRDKIVERKDIKIKVGEVH